MTTDSREPRDEPPIAKRLIIGDPLTSHKLDDQLLPKKMALPIFASDALSSVAYAPQELLMILLTGGLAFLVFAPWIALAVVVVLAVVVISYRQLIKAYPSGGGDYEVASKNLGEIPGVIVASALLVDYVLTVAVSVASGVDNIISAVPVLNGGRVELAVGFVIVIVIVNLRGVREASLVFALPTYIFIGSVAVMIIVGLARVALGEPPVASSAEYAVKGESLTQAAFILLLLRAFSSGCSALTGVEAVANGVPAFRKPKVRNAQATLVLMGSIAVCLFAGLTALALFSGVHYAEDPCNLIGFDCQNVPQPSLMAQVAGATFGIGSIPFYIIQAATACVLLLAANTAFNGFPLLGSVLARDGYAPKALNTRGDRLVFSNGMIILGIAAIGILIVFQASLTNLIQLYIIGVFVSFSLGQIGMVRHWRRLLRDLKKVEEVAASAVDTAAWTSLSTLPQDGPSAVASRTAPGFTPISAQNIKRDRQGAKVGLVINSIGATLTVFVLVIVTITKFTHGAYLVFIMIPILATLMVGVNRYYRDVDHEIRVDDETHFGSEGDVALILVSKLQKPVIKAIDYALAATHDKTLAIHIAVNTEESEALQRQWQKHAIPIPLVIIESPYRTFASPVAQFIKEYRATHGSSIVTVYLPQYIVGHWWESILHNRRSRRIANQLMLVHGVSINLVPWLLDSSELIYGRRSRPLPGQERGGLPAEDPDATVPVKADSIKR
ncbi:amino acid permease [Microbacterium deminutum]|uniref:amino acid permease n=1 Tax=Microbacterium deminutum TaxID=344164 RepID=UPI003CD0A36E